VGLGTSARLPLWAEGQSVTVPWTRDKTRDGMKSDWCQHRNESRRTVRPSYSPMNRCSKFTEKLPPRATFLIARRASIVARLLSQNDGGSRDLTCLTYGGGRRKTQCHEVASKMAVVTGELYTILR
jgi:hypothetical protein